MNLSLIYLCIRYLESFYVLLDYINSGFRTKYGNIQGNEFKIHHGSIIVNIQLDNDKLTVTALFVALPEKGRVPLLRQVAGLNFNAMDLAMIYLQDITAQGKAVVEKLQKMTKEELAEDLYFVETFIPGKRRSNLQNIQENFEDSYKKVSAHREADDYMTACIMRLYKFYEMYYYNNLQQVQVLL